MAEFVQLIVSGTATGAIYAEAWTPTLQKMVAGREDSATMLKEVQDEYVKELSR